MERFELIGKIKRELHIIRIMEGDRQKQKTEA
jgi:hypothetical protein